MPDSPTLSEVIDDFINSKKAERLSPATIETYEKVLKLFREFLGSERAFKTITASDIRAYLGSLDHVCDKTVCSYYIVLSSLWTFAVSENLTSDHMVRKINKPRYARRKIVPFTENEIKRILAAGKSMREQAIIMTLIDCGIRASELVNLKVKDWRPGRLKVMGKGRKERNVPISEITERLILLQLKIGQPGLQAGNESLFNGAYQDKPIDYDALRYLMHRLGKQSGVSDCHAHRFRHTFAISYLRNGGDIYTLQQILGHSTLEMVKHYLAIARSDIDKAHAKASPVKNWNLGANLI